MLEICIEITRSLQGGRLAQPFSSWKIRQVTLTYGDMSINISYLPGEEIEHNIWTLSTLLYICHLSSKISRISSQPRWHRSKVGLCYNPCRKAESSQRRTLNPRSIRPISEIDVSSYTFECPTRLAEPPLLQNRSKKQDMCSKFVKTEQQGSRLGLPWRRITIAV